MTHVVAYSCIEIVIAVVIAPTRLASDIGAPFKRRTQMRQLILLVTIAAASPSLASAQDVASLRQGVRVEVTTKGGKAQTGTLLSLTSDSLTFARDSRANATASIGIGNMSSVRVSQGRSSGGGAMRSGLIGSGIGILAGGVLGAMMYTKPESCPDAYCFITNGLYGSRGNLAAAVGVAGGAAGLIVGSVYGAVTGREKWKDVMLPKR